MDAAMRRELNDRIAAIGRDCPAPLATPTRHLVEKLVEPGQRETFGAWVLAQQDRGDWIDDLAAAARADRRFPRHGTVEDVRAHLHLLGADGDAFEQLDDAERCWLTL